MDWLLQYTDPSIDWGYAMSTLMVRFLGVFVVLGIVQAAIQLASRLIRAAGAGVAEPTANAVAGTASGAADLSPVSEAGGGIDQATAAAIGLALALEAGDDGATKRRSASGSSSAWAMAGRLRNLR